MRELKKNIKAQEKLAKKQRAQEMKLLRADDAKKAKELNLDAIHDTVHEMARDEARHGKAFQGLLDRYFK